MKNKLFISLGVGYQDKLLENAKNREIYDNSDFSPTKPIEGGFGVLHYYKMTIINHIGRNILMKN